MVSSRSKFLRLIFIIKWSWIYLTICNIFFRPSRILSATLKLWLLNLSFMQMRWCYVDIFLAFFTWFLHIILCIFTLKSIWLTVIHKAKVFQRCHIICKRCQDYMDENKYWKAYLRVHNVDFGDESYRLSVNELYPNT